MLRQQRVRPELITLDRNSMPEQHISTLEYLFRPESPCALTDLSHSRYGPRPRHGYSCKLLVSKK